MALPHTFDATGKAEVDQFDEPIVDGVDVEQLPNDPHASDAVNTDPKNPEADEIPDAPKGVDQEPESRAPQYDDSNAEDDDPKGPVGDAGADTTTDDPEIFAPRWLEAAGLSAEEAKEQFGTPDVLERAVRMLDQRFVERGRDALSRQPAPQFQPTQTPVQRPEVQAPEFVQFEIPKPADGSDWDPDVIALAQSLNRYHEQQNKALAAQLAKQQEILLSQVQERHKQAEAEYVREFDEFIGELGESFEPLFGKGSGHGLNKKSIAFENRVHLDQVAAQLHAGILQSGHTLPSRKDLLARAVHVAFPEQQAEAVRKEVTEKITTRSRQITARPTQRRQRASNPDATAAKNADQWFRDRGMPVAEDPFDYGEI